MKSKFSVLIFLISSVVYSQTATGIVFNDSNVNGKMDSNEKGVEKVSVSNGVEVVQTDSEGKWTLPITEDTGLFVIKPSNYAVPVNANMIPQHYYLHKPNGSPKSAIAGVEPTGKLPKSINFPIVYKPEPKKFKTLFFGDTQTTTAEEVNYLNHDIVEDLIGSEANFGVILGDIVGDDTQLFTEISEGIGQIGIPWYYVYGNHDDNMAAKKNEHRDETYERYFGPSNFAFEVGEVVFIGFNNVYFKPDGKYKSHFSEDQIQFLKNYLSFVPDDKLIVLMMHIPIFNCENKEQLFDVLKDRQHTFSISAHVHDQINIFLDEEYGWKGNEPHHHLINATACGSWWSGQLDEEGIPHSTMKDGAPNGHSIITFDGNTYNVEFKAARRPADYQMNIYTPNKIDVTAIGTTKVLVNVFAGSEKSIVQMKVGKNGQWQTLKKIDQIDPEILRMHNLTPFFKLQLNGEEIENTLGRPMGYPKISRHMWEGNLLGDLKLGANTIQVKTTDMYGQHYKENRIIYVYDGLIDKN
ncbi:MAG: calcineurin-like phosphoesterase C-terminal domain-containing protein [Flavobacteriaceae bacterium]|nr:calcineurin-like phosphoesterase C-terminal domain-containing protein [Flavobacteriaceae bacterium]